MTTRNSIGTLSYFARKINFAAGFEKAELLEEGESIRIVGARDSRAVNAARVLSGSDWVAQLPAATETEEAQARTNRSQDLWNSKWSLKT